MSAGAGPPLASTLEDLGLGPGRRGELRIVAVGSVLEETPEGLYHADRIRDAAGARRRLLEATLAPFVLAELDELELELERRILG